VVSDKGEYGIVEKRKSRRYWYAMCGRALEFGRLVRCHVHLITFFTRSI